MEFITVDTYEEMSRKAANIIAAQVILKKDSVLGLATGSTPIGTYKRLIELCESGDVDFSGVKTVNLDEYCDLPVENDQSYRYFMDHNLFDHINIDKANTNVPNGNASNIKRECTRYDKLIDNLGGVDVQLLGIGNNGHIGFNEPGEAFDKGTHVIELKESTRQANSRFFDGISFVPRFAITMGIKSIMSARRIILVANGQGKKDIVEKAFFGEVTPEIPASVLQLHPNVTVIFSEN